MVRSDKDLNLRQPNTPCRTAMSETGVIIVTDLPFANVAQR